MKKSSISFLLYFSFIITSFIGFTVLVPSLFYLINWPINSALLISFLLAVTSIYFFIKNDSEKNLAFFVRIVFAFITAFFICCFIAGHTYDFSYDGNMYHQQAIIALSKGWNPVKNYEFDLIKDNLSKYAIYHYPKAIWMSAACIVAVFKYIEYGKAVNFLGVIAAFSLLIHLIAALSPRIKKFWVIIFSAAIVLNPVVISQLFTFYVDLQVYLMIVLLLSLSILIYKNGRNNLLYFFYLFAGMILINIKFTSFVYGVFLIGGFNLYLILIKSLYLKKVLLSSIFIAVIGIGVVGAGTFIKNMYYYGHPFYPLFGNKEKKTDVMESQTSEKFFIKNRFQKVFYSFFSRSEELPKEEDRLPVFKIPFSFKRSEVTVLAKGGGVRIGGFGPLFGGIFIFSTLIYLLKIKIIDYRIHVLLGMVFLSGMLNPEAWWARLSPQFWLLPFIIVIPVFYYLKKTIKTTLLAMILFNVCLVTAPQFIQQVSNTISLYRQTEILTNINKPLVVDFRPFWGSSKERIKHFNLKYIEADNSKCAAKVSCLRSDAKICLDNLTKADQLKLLETDKKDLKEFFLEKIR